MLAYGRSVLDRGETAGNVEVASRLNEICQACHVWPTEEFVGSGPDNDRYWTCYLDWAHLSTEGYSKTKKEARMIAKSNLLNLIIKIHNTPRIGSA